MKTPQLVRVCSLEEIPAGEARGFTVEGFEIAIFNTGDEIYAIENRCPHMGAELAEGEVVDTSVCCHNHGWLIDLETGEVADREGIVVPTFPVTIEDGEIYIQIA